MHEAESALRGAAYEGFANVTEAGLRGMITLRGNLASVRIKNAATGVAGVDMPGQRGINLVGEKGLAWMSPDELMILLPYAEVPKALATFTKSLNKQHALVADVSDARVVFHITGGEAAEVLAKLCPVDLATFPEGEIRRTRLAQVPAAFWRIKGGFALVCFRSVADYAFGVLKASARPGGEVGYL